MSEQTKPERKDIGALWEKTSQNGMRYMSGTINGQRVAIFRNKYKEEGDNKPHWRIFPEAERQANGQGGPAPARPSRAQADDTTSDDIPF